ncbi:MAG: hypothetical protein Q8P11_03990 [bacterium]|nr:hypothetical protein [bacterium]
MSQDTQQVKTVVLVKCVDWRLHETAEEYIKQQLQSQYPDHLIKIYVLRVAGACKDLDDASKHASDIMGIAHDVEYMYLCNHLNCGAYASRVASEGLDAQGEEEMHRNEVARLKDIMQEKFPELNIISLIERLVNDAGAGMIELDI